MGKRKTNVAIKVPKDIEIEDTTDSPFKHISRDLKILKSPTKGPSTKVGRKSKANMLIGVNKVSTFRFEGAAPPDSGIT